MTNRTIEHGAVFYPKRKFNFALGLKRNFQAYSEYMGLGSLSDHLYFTGILMIFIPAIIVLLTIHIGFGGY